MARGLRVLRRRGPSALALLLLAGVGLWLRPYGMAVYHTERGLTLLAEALRPVFPDRLAPEHILDAERLNRAIAHLQAALAWDPRHRAARLGLARAYAAQNQTERALDALAPALAAFPRDPLLWLACGDLQDMRGDAEAAVQAYERGLVGNRVAPLVANYLKLAEAQTERGNRELAIRWWQRVLALDPGNLYALYRLWQVQAAIGDLPAAAERIAQLRRFPASSVRVPVDLDFRLPRAQAMAMAALVEGGIWDAATLHRVVWAQAAYGASDLQALMTEELLRTLSRRRPGDLWIRFALAEVLQRQGAWEEAEALYREILAWDPGFAPALLRLGGIAEARAAAGEVGALREAARWYQRYREQAPEDLLGLRRWVEACAALAARGEAEAACAGLAEGRRAWQERTDDREEVARWLGVPAARLTLGPNRLANGGFEAEGEAGPSEWTWSDMSNRPPWNPGLFLGGMVEPDAYAGRRSACVDGLWTAQEPGREGARAGYWAARVRLGPGWYVLSFAYRAQLAPSGRVGVWVSTRPEVLFAGEQWLPDTGGAWRRAVIVGRNTMAEGEVAVLLRLWGEGVVCFDEVALQEIGGAEAVSVEGRSLPWVVIR